MRELRPMRSLSGHDARCHVCWHPVYRGWIEAEDPAGRCPWGHVRATDCREAMAREHDAAGLLKLRRAGAAAPAGGGDV